jgi:hypothetical protein
MSSSVSSPCESRKVRKVGSVLCHGIDTRGMEMAPFSVGKVRDERMVALEDEDDDL